MGKNKRKMKKLNESIDKKCGEILEQPIGDITLRLSYPVVINNGEFESEDDMDDEMETIVFDFRPRKTFLSNSCLVCSRISSPKLVCEYCRMVSYCTEDHRRKDAASHQDLCKILRESNYLEKDGKFFDRNNNDTPSPEEYRMLRVKMINLTEGLLHRYLELWEKEIILYPRACFKCHWNGGKDYDNSLECCPDCKLVFWCKNHCDNHSTKWCLEYKLFHRIILAQTIYGNADPIIPNAYFIAPNLSLNNFDSLMSMVHDKSNGNCNSDYFRKMDFYNYTTLSHMASIPLTTLYGLQKIRGDWKGVENLILHIIGAEFHYEGINLRVWEKFFHHFLPNLNNLKIFIIGPELIIPDLAPINILSKVKLCRVCKSRNKTIDVSFVPRTLYHDFCRSPEYQKPDLTCLFNPGLYRATGFNGHDTWPRTIFELCKTNVPLLVTAYTEHEIPLDIERIKAVCPNVEVILEPKKNPFASLKPDRNFVSDESIPLIYKNYFISIVKPDIKIL